MNPPPLDVDVCARRLRAIDDALASLEALRHDTATQLAEDPLRRAAAERLLQVVVDLAVDVNAHLATTVLGRAPTSARESFALAGEVGAISADLASALAPSAGLRNVLVHRYVDIREDLVAAAVPLVLDRYRTYVVEVARWLDQRAGPQR